MKENYYYSLLKPTADPEILAMPIEALGLKPAVIEEIKKLKNIRHGRSYSVIQTVGDLVSYGYSGLVSYFSITRPRYDDLREKVYHVEEKLAKLGLKFEDSDFSIGDVRVTELSQNAQKTIRSFGKNMKTLDDVIIFRYGRMAQYSYFGSAELNELESEIARYGLKIEGSPNSLDKSKVFSLKNYISYLPTKYLVEKGTLSSDDSKSKAIKPRINLAELSRDDLMEADICHLGFIKKHNAALHELEIYNVGDLVEYGESELREHLPLGTIRCFQEKLAEFNLKMEGSTVDVENGQLVVLRKHGIKGTKNGLTPDAPKSVDVMTLSDAEREKFLKTPILEFGFNSSISSCFKGSDKYITIGDLIQAPKNQIIAIMKNSSYSMLRSALKQYNLKLAPSTVVNESKYYDANKIIQNVDVRTMNEKEKTEFLAKKLEDVGFKKFVVNFFSKFNPPVTTLGEMIGKTTTEIKELGLTDANLLGIRRLLYMYGLNFEKSKRKSLSLIKKSKTKASKRKEIQINQSQGNLEAVEKIDMCDKKVQLSDDIQVLGITPVITGKLRKGGIKTVGELIVKTHKDLASIGLNVVNATKVQNKLKQYGLSLTLLKTRRKKPDEVEKTEETKLQGDIALLGISPAITKKLKNVNINTIEELTSFTHSDLIKKGFNSYNLVKITEKLEAKNLTLKKKYKAKQNTEPLSITETGEQLLALDIEVLKFSPVIDKKLRGMKITTIADLVSHTKTELNKILRNDGQSRQITKKLGEVGLEVKSVDKSPNVMKNFKQTDLRGKELLSADISVIGITPVICDKLRSLNINTVGELVQQSFSDLKTSGFYSNNLTKIKKQLTEVGLDFKKLHKGRKPKTTKIVQSQIEQEKSPTKKFEEEIKIPRTRKEQMDSEIVEFTSSDLKSSQNNSNIETDKQQHTGGRVMSSQTNPEFKKALENLETGLKEKGIWALYDVNSKYFASCSLELEELKEKMREYFDLQFEILIMTATSEDMLTSAEKKIEKEASTFETIVEQKQMELRSTDESLNKKKTLSASAMRKKVFDRINKFYHDEFFNTPIVEDKSLDQNQEIDELNKF